MKTYTPVILTMNFSAVCIVRTVKLTICYRVEGELWCTILTLREIQFWRDFLCPLWKLAALCNLNFVWEFLCVFSESSGFLTFRGILRIVRSRQILLEPWETRLWDTIYVRLKSAGEFKLRLTNRIIIVDSVVTNQLLIDNYILDIIKFKRYRRQLHCKCTLKWYILPLCAKSRYLPEVSETWRRY